MKSRKRLRSAWKKSHGILLVRARKTTSETEVKPEECDDIDRTAIAQDSDEPSGHIKERIFHEWLNPRLQWTEYFHTTTDPFMGARTHKDVCGWSTCTYLLDLSTRWRWVVSFMLRPIYAQGNNPRYPLDRKLNGPQWLYERYGEKRNFLPLPGIDPQLSNPSIYRLSYYKSTGNTLGLSSGSVRSNLRRSN
jgi:hypothetical protein